RDDHRVVREDRARPDEDDPLQMARLLGGLALDPAIELAAVQVGPLAEHAVCDVVLDHLAAPGTDPGGRAEHEHLADARARASRRRVRVVRGSRRDVGRWLHAPRAVRGSGAGVLAATSAASRPLSSATRAGSRVKTLSSFWVKASISWKFRDPNVATGSSTT